MVNNYFESSIYQQSSFRISHSIHYSSNNTRRYKMYFYTKIRSYNRNTCTLS